MSLDESDAAIIQRWSGNITDSEAIEAAIARLGDPHIVALEVMMTQLANGLASYKKMRLDGDATWDQGDHLEQLKARIAALVGICKGLPGLSAVAMEVCAAGESVGTSGETARLLNYTVLHDRP